MECLEEESKVKTIIRLIIPILLLASAQAVLAGTNDVWASSELNETFMHSLTKQDCMNKQYAELKTRCTGKDCLQNLSAITGDCVSYAKGDSKQFCKVYFNKNVQPYCDTKQLSGEQCVYLMVGYEVFCKGK